MTTTESNYSAPLRPFFALFSTTISFRSLIKAVSSRPHFTWFARTARVTPRLDKLAIARRANLLIPSGVFPLSGRPNLEHHFVFAPPAAEIRYGSASNLLLPEAAVASISRLWVSTVTCIQPSNRDRSCPTIGEADLPVGYFEGAQLSALSNDNGAECKAHTRASC